MCPVTATRTPHGAGCGNDIIHTVRAGALVGRGAGAQPDELCHDTGQDGQRSNRCQQSFEHRILASSQEISYRDNYFMEEIGAMQLTTNNAIIPIMAWMPAGAVTCTIPPAQCR
jgi:hypothetical protein